MDGHTHTQSYCGKIDTQYTVLFWPSGTRVTVVKSTHNKLSYSDHMVLANEWIDSAYLLNLI